MGWEQYLKYPLEDPDWAKKILLGCVILIVPIINIITLGYFMECIRLGSKGKWILPEWNNWGEYFMQGLIALLIVIVYMLIPLIMYLIPGIGTFFAAVFFTLTGILIPMALANYAINLNIKLALNIKKILYQISRIINYYMAAYFLLVLITGMGISFCLSVSLFTFIGSLLIFYSGIVYFNMAGQFYQAAVYG